ncbi:MAG: glycosyltransferase family 4 protein [Candidatus Bathyarchaeota archaeon]
MGFFYSGGGERTVLNQAKGLEKKGHQVKVYTPIIEENCFPELRKDIEVIQISNKVPESTPFKTALKMIESSLRVPIKEFRDRDILIAHGQPSNWIAYQVSKKTAIPYISYLHQANRFLHPREIDQKTGWSTDPSLALLNTLHKNNAVISKLDNLSITTSRIILTNSNWIRGKILQAYQKNSVICYPGVDKEKFNPSKKKPENKILTTNRHIPQKRIDYLIKCVKQISVEYPEIECIITGETTSHTRELKEITSKLRLEKNVTFTGKLSSEQLVSTYQSAYTYGYTSQEEDFGLGPLEAAACNVPSIVWDYAGPRETEINGKTGYRIRPYDLDEMAKKHIQLLGDPDLREKLGKNARKHIENRFTWETHCNRLEQVMEKVLNC